MVGTVLIINIKILRSVSGCGSLASVNAVSSCMEVAQPEAPGKRNFMNVVWPGATMLPIM